MKPLKLFISYSHKDEAYKDGLITHLSSLKRRGIVEEWHDRKLVSGQEWDGTINKELLNSDMILLLISSHFLASNYCYGIEVEKAMERHERGEAKVIPIIIRPCDWKQLPFSKLQGLPKDAKALSKWNNKDEGYLSIIDGIKVLIDTQGETKNDLVSSSASKNFVNQVLQMIKGAYRMGYQSQLKLKNPRRNIVIGNCFIHDTGLVMLQTNKSLVAEAYIKDVRNDSFGISVASPYDFHLRLTIDYKNVDGHKQLKLLAGDFYGTAGDVPFWGDIVLIPQKNINSFETLQKERQTWSFDPKSQLKKDDWLMKEAQNFKKLLKKRQDSRAKI